MLRPVPNRIPSSEFRVQLLGTELGSFQAGFLGIPHEFFSSSEDIQGGAPGRARRRALQAGEATRHRSGLLAHGGGWARGAAVAVQPAPAPSSSSSLPDMPMISELG
jgi:hypothetical protein